MSEARVIEKDIVRRNPQLTADGCSCLVYELADVPEGVMGIEVSTYNRWVTGVECEIQWLS